MMIRGTKGGLEFDGLCVVLDRTFEVVEIGLCKSPSVVRIRVKWVQGNRLIKIFDRSEKIADLPIGNASIVVGQSVVRLNGNGLSKLRNGLFRLIPCAVCDAKIHMSDCLMSFFGS